MAAGARLTPSCLPSCLSALAVPRIERRGRVSGQRAKRPAKENAPGFWSNLLLNPAPLLHALRLPIYPLRPLRPAHGHLSLQSDSFLVVGIDVHRAGRVLARFTPGRRVPEIFGPGEYVPRIILGSAGPKKLRSSMPRSRLLITTAQIDAAAEQKGFGIRWLEHHHSESRPLLRRLGHAGKDRESW